MSSTCWGMKVPSKKSSRSTIHFTQTSSPRLKRSFSSSKPITARLFFCPHNNKDAVISVIQKSKHWSSEKWNEHWPLLAQSIATTDPHEIVNIWGTIYSLECYIHKNINKKQEQRLRSIEYEIAKKNNEYIHALASSGSDLPLLFHDNALLK